MWLPPGVTQEMFKERQRREGEAMQALDPAGQQEWVERFNRELKAIDPYLKLLWCPDPAPVDAVACGAQPGRWHVMRHNPGAPISLLPITGPDGQYVEPNSAVFEKLRASDWWSPEVMRERKRVKEELERAKERREAQERAAFDQEMLERWQAVSRAQISMSRDQPWSQNVKGRRRVRADQR